MVCSELFVLCAYLGCLLLCIEAAACVAGSHGFTLVVSLAWCACVVPAVQCVAAVGKCNCVFCSCLDAVEAS